MWVYLWVCLLVGWLVGLGLMCLLSDVGVCVLLGWVMWVGCRAIPTYRSTDDDDDLCDHTHPKPTVSTVGTVSCEKGVSPGPPPMARGTYLGTHCAQGWKARDCVSK